jgi:hypothetical protein
MKSRRSLNEDKKAKFQIGFFLNPVGIIIRRPVCETVWSHYDYDLSDNIKKPV